MAAAGSWRALGGKCRMLMCTAPAPAPATATATATASVSAARNAANKKVSPEFARKVEKLLQGIVKPCPVSPALQQFLGSPDHVSRATAIDKVLTYIKTNKLEDPENTKEINCDDKLKTLFKGRDRVGFQEIDTFLRDHFVFESSADTPPTADNPNPIESSAVIPPTADNPNPSIS